jgi:hypothetical protein
MFSRARKSLSFQGKRGIVAGVTILASANAQKQPRNATQNDLPFPLVPRSFDLREIRPIR